MGIYIQDLEEYQRKRFYAEERYMSPEYVANSRRKFFDIISRPELEDILKEIPFLGHLQTESVAFLSGGRTFCSVLDFKEKRSFFGLRKKIARQPTDYILIIEHSYFHDTTIGYYVSWERKTDFDGFNNIQVSYQEILEKVSEETKMEMLYYLDLFR